MKILRKILMKISRAAAKPYGHVVIPQRETMDFYLHEYRSYEEYRDTQIFHNKRKIDSVWADERTLRRVRNIVSASRPNNSKIVGLCHGTRNGFEQKFLNSLDRRMHVSGTDISDTAESFDNSFQWDFHDIKTEWENAFDFIYTNSLDQSWKPKKALGVWLNQIKEDGLLFIEHTIAHGPTGASEMDPFGVKPTVVPYVLSMWFGRQISISHSVERKSNKDIDAWLFVISKNVRNVVEL